MKAIICFTASYPYSKGEETFFGKELKFISKEFDVVFIQPLYNPSKSEEKWPLPENVICWEPLPSQKLKLAFNGAFNLAPVKLFLSDFIRKRVYLSLDKFSRWLHSFLLFRLLYVRVKEKAKALDKTTVFYSYWANALIFPSKFFRQFKKVVRMHGGDYYLYRNNNYLPIREKIYEFSDLLVPISKDIFQDLKNSYNIKENKIYISRLGVLNNMSSCSTPNMEVIKIVSCSNLIPLKRVNLIAESLCSLISFEKIEWHHFGEGDEYLKIKSISKSFPTNIKAIFHGWLPNEDLFNFYKENYISWFINVSIYEGIPVSIMEAFSFGIPAIATNVGGTGEIVNINNGYLIPCDFNTEIVGKLILECTSSEYFSKRTNAYETWATKYDANKNYFEFVNRIKGL